MSTNALPLQPSSTTGWRSGFASLLHKEDRAAWGGKRWLVQSVIWLGLVNGLLTMLLFLAPNVNKAAARGGGSVPPGMTTPAGLGLTAFFTLLTLTGTIGAVILAHDKIVGEKQTGTAAWILSKPVSRPAFVLSKVTAGLLRLAIFSVALPGLVAYGELSLAAGGPLAVWPFLAALGLAMLDMAFYFTLTLMSSALFDQRGAILAVGLGVLFSLQIVASVLPPIALISPLDLPQVMTLLAQAQPLPVQAVFPIVFTALWSVVFVGVALWKFEHLEL